MRSSSPLTLPRSSSERAISASNPDSIARRRERARQLAHHGRRDDVDGQGEPVARVVERERMHRRQEEEVEDRASTRRRRRRRSAGPSGSRSAAPRTRTARRGSGPGRSCSSSAITTGHDCRLRRCSPRRRARGSARRAPPRFGASGYRRSAAARANHARATGAEAAASAQIDGIFRPRPRTFRRRLHVSGQAAPEMTAGELLGRTHPLTCAVRRFESACLQLLTGVALLAAIDALRARARAPPRARRRHRQPASCSPGSSSAPAAAAPARTRADHRRS